MKTTQPQLIARLNAQLLAQTYRYPVTIHISGTQLSRLNKIQDAIPNKKLSIEEITRFATEEGIRELERLYETAMKIA